MKALVITIGNEILCGDIINKDLAIIANIAKEYGIYIDREVTVKDDITAIVNALREGSQYQFIFLSGGLGPTEDDVTRKAIATFIGSGLIFDENLLEKVKRKIREWDIPENPLHENYGFRPEGCKPVENPKGLAPGILCKHGDQYLIVLPGPPRELESTLQNALLKIGLVKEKHGIVKIYRTFGTREVDLQNMMKKININNELEIGYYPSIYGVKLKIKYPNQKVMESIEPVIKGMLGKDLYSDNDEEIPDVLGKILRHKSLTLSVAESCTGGLVGDLITSVSGSSTYFMGGIIAYSNDVKVKLLGCSEDDLKKYGAVSEQIAMQMAEGARKYIKTDIGISTTGIAGPTGGTPQKPVGLVYMGYSDGKNQKVIRKIFKGKREEIKRQSALWVIDLARRILS